MEKKVLVMTGGGTAGHVLPCLALLPFLKSFFTEIHFIGSNSGYEKKLVGDSAIYHGIDAVKLSRGGKNILKAFGVPFKLAKAKRQAAALLRQIRPDAIFSKGGYVALPVVLAAKKHPHIFMHESDMTLGLANRLSRRRCKYLFTSFDTIESDDAIHTGAPIRQSIYYGSREDAVKKYGLGARRPCLLVVGGSSGAKAINDIVLGCLNELCARFDVLHITGEKLATGTERAGYKAIGYTDKIEDCYALADFVLSRGGSGALFELMALKKPTLIVPLPKGASRGDQIDNAEYFCKRGAALILKQEQMTAGSLLSSLDKLIASKAALKDGMSSLGRIDGTRKIAQIIIDDCK